jgi:hypothetical protein
MTTELSRKVSWNCMIIGTRRDMTNLFNATIGIHPVHDIVKIMMELKVGGQQTIYVRIPM